MDGAFEFIHGWSSELLRMSRRGSATAADALESLRSTLDEWGRQITVRDCGPRASQYEVLRRMLQKCIEELPTSERWDDSEDLLVLDDRLDVTALSGILGRSEGAIRRRRSKLRAEERECHALARSHR